MEHLSEPAIQLTASLPLSTQQASSFYAFKKCCAEQGLLDAPAGMGENDVRDGINDDATLLRFFHCRQFNVQGALSQFRDAYIARQANRVCEFYENVEVRDYEETRKIYPYWIGRCDKRGLPICAFDITQVDSKTMTAYKTSCLSMLNLNSADSKNPSVVSMEVLRSFTFFDGLTRFIMPLLSAVPGRPDLDKPITRTIFIVDISGISMKQVWDLKTWIQDFSKLLSINYPEILDRVLIMGAPSYFSAMWRWVKGWLDPVTVSKIVILSPEKVLPTLEEYIDIANIPKRFGGGLEFELGSKPLLDSVINGLLTWLPAGNKTLPMGPLKWIDGADGSRIAVAVGKDGGNVRCDRIAILKSRK